MKNGNIGFKFALQEYERQNLYRHQHLKYLLEGFKDGYEKGENDISNKIVSLIFDIGLTEEQINRICEVVNPSF